MTTQMSISNMIRHTATDTADFYSKVADHIDHLEKTISNLEQKLNEFKTLDLRDIDDHK